ncbi:MAG: hypothetical protein ACK4Z8_17245, partial [Novosphingobium sp.]
MSLTGPAQFGALVLALAAVLPLITLAAIAVAVKAAAARSRFGLVMSKSPDFDVSCGNRLFHVPS